MRRGRAVAAVIALVVAAVVAAELVAAAGNSTKTVLDVGVLPIYPIAPMKPGATACQQPLGITESFDRVRVNVGTFGKPGPPLLISVLDQDTKTELGSARVEPGWVDDGTAQNVNVGTIKPDRLVAICIRNEGRVTAYVYGNIYGGDMGQGPLGVAPTNSSNYLVVDQVPLRGDMSITLSSSRERSLLSRIPTVLRHAGAFKPPWVDAWTFWLLGLLIVLAAPFALWKAAVSAAGGGDSASVDTLGRS
jgi:hypothetical protein